MMISCEARLLRLYVNADQKWRGKPLYRAVVELARHCKLAGASVFTVELGYGTHRRIHDCASEYSSFDVPIVIEIVDSTERVLLLLAELDTMVGEGLIAVRSATVIRYTHGTEGEIGQTGPSVRGESQARSAGRESEAVRAFPMRIEGDAKRVTVYVGSADTWRGRNLALAIVEKCRAMGLAGATVSRGIMGFGKHSVIHKAHILGLSDDLPEKIEVIDRPEEIERLLPALDQMVGGCIIVVEDVHVIRHRGA
jgi:PII-like signaling protein